MPISKNTSQTPDRQLQLPEGVLLSDTSIFYIGFESLAQTNAILNLSGCKAFFSYNPLS
ncbi:hypothetical protein HK096_001959, partial [Nowakowskiella sp. JEL0078]